MGLAFNKVRVNSAPNRPGHHTNPGVTPTLVTFEAVGFDVPTYVPEEQDGREINGFAEKKNGSHITYMNDWSNKTTLFSS